MSPETGKTEWTAEALTALRTEVAAVMAADNLTKRKLASEVGVPEGTLGPWVDDKYRSAGGTHEREAEVAEAVQRWLQTRADRAASAIQPIRVPGWQDTPTGRKYLTALEHAHFTGDMVMVAGGPGTGKTAAIRQHKATRPRTFVTTMSPASSTLVACLGEVLTTLGRPEAHGTPNALSRQISGRLVEPGALLVIDEAQHLHLRAVEELRSIHDRTGSGSFVGDQTLPVLFGVWTQKTGYGQLSSRLGWTVKVNRPVGGDVCALLAGWGIEEPAAKRVCKEIADKAGALRMLTKTLVAATRLAGGVTPSAAQIREIWQQREVGL